MDLGEIGEGAPATPELKRPQTPLSREAMKDEGEVEEPTKPAGNANQTAFVVDEEQWEQGAEEYANEIWSAFCGGGGR